jgi:protein-L-isoaspartate O-methyltransferase
MDWTPSARRLAGQVTHATSRWRPIVEAVPRHVFVPRWWSWLREAPGPYGSAVWELKNGLSDRAEWFEAAYADRSLVTRVGTAHADDAEPGDRPTGSPTSSATLPALVVRMFQHARITDGHDVLDVGTGSGYGAALLAERFGDEHVTSVDVDPYLVSAAEERLEGIGRRPTLRTVDATGPLDGSWDRIVATVSVRPVPASWPAALRSGGRLVTTLAGTGLILTADRTPDGGARGRIEWDRAGFMAARSGLDRSGEVTELIQAAWIAEANPEQSPFPVVNVMEAWELYSMLGVTVPGLEHDYRETADGGRAAVMVHPDGSWARATGSSDGPATVRQGGPRRLWSVLDDQRARWLRDGSLPVYGARATIDPDGTITLRRGRWSTVIRE